MTARARRREAGIGPRSHNWGKGALEATLVMKSHWPWLELTYNESRGSVEALLSCISVLETTGLGRRGRAWEGWWEEQELGAGDEERQLGLDSLSLVIATNHLQRAEALVEAGGTVRTGERGERS